MAAKAIEDPSSGHIGDPAVAFRIRQPHIKGMRKPLLSWSEIALTFLAALGATTMWGWVFHASFWQTVVLFDVIFAVGLAWRQNSSNT